MDPRINQVKTLMERHLARDLRADKIARLLGLSVSRLQHLFKDETGTTMVRYHKAIRIERARELLEHTTLSIKQIASAVGTGDTSHFTRDFRKEEGLSPRRYRLNFLTKNRRERQRWTDLERTKSNERRTKK